MVNNKKCIIDFLRGIENNSLHLTSKNNKLFSYNTCIAELVGWQTLIINPTKYSVTTSKHLTILKREAIGFKIGFIPSNIPIGTQSLKNYKVQYYV